MTVSSPAQPELLPVLQSSLKALPVLLRGHSYQRPASTHSQLIVSETYSLT